MDVTEEKRSRLLPQHIFWLITVISLIAFGIAMFSVRPSVALKLARVTRGFSFQVESDILAALTRPDQVDAQESSIWIFPDPIGQSQLVQNALKTSQVVQEGRYLFYRISAVPLSTSPYWDPTWRESFLKDLRGQLTRRTESPWAGVLLEGASFAALHSERENASQEMVEWLAVVASELRNARENFIVLMEGAPCLGDPKTYPDRSDREKLIVGSLYWATAQGWVIQGPIPEGDKRAFIEGCVNELHRRAKRVFFLPSDHSDDEERTWALGQGMMLIEARSSPSPSQESVQKVKR